MAFRSGMPRPYPGGHTRGMDALEPIAHEYELACDALHAYETYTGRIGEWWDPRYTANPETLETVTIERWLGGRVYATHSDLGRHDWGEVTAWQAGHRLTHTFTLAQGRNTRARWTSSSLPHRLAARCALPTAGGRRRTPASAPSSGTGG